MFGNADESKSGSNLTESAIAKLPFKFKVSGNLSDDDIHNQKSVKFSLQRQEKLWTQYRDLVADNVSKAGEVDSIQTDTKASALNYLEKLAENASRLGIQGFKTEKALNAIASQHDYELDLADLASGHKLEAMQQKYSLRGQELQAKHQQNLASLSGRFDEKMKMIQAEKPKQQARELEIIDLDF